MSSTAGFAPSTAITTPAQFLDAYEAVDIIGNGSFGVIRKVRRKEDGAIFARKELNFERMNERDKKQIVAEVNILKDLNHENIVRYHDRFVDSDQGMLYIVMEYCGGGDLGGVISGTKKKGQLIPEDTVWDYFLQIVLALHHCHSPHIKPGTANELLPNVAKRAPILHRDIKPENIFLDAKGTVKLGDFGLSKQLGAQAFTNTYVGTPYYMSPELFADMHYDSKSDIWSLGCLVYELCALNPPFHEAQTHAELASYVKKGRVPTLPPQYGHYLQAAIKAMMSLEPAKRPSAANLLAHERMNLAFKTRETQEMLNKVVGHRQTLHARAEKLDKREQEIASREQEILRREQEFQAIAIAKEAEIMSQVAAREEEMRQWVFTREAELKREMLAQEEATQQAVSARELELERLWNEREAQLRAEIARKDAEIQEREETLKREAEKLHRERLAASSEPAATTNAQKPRKSATETKNDPAPSRVGTVKAAPVPLPPAFETPAPQKIITVDDLGSAMKGVVLADGQAVPTPAASKLRDLLSESPSKRVDLVNIFERNPPQSSSLSSLGTFGTGKTLNFGDYDEKENSPIPTSVSDSVAAPTKRLSINRTKQNGTAGLPTWDEEGDANANTTPRIGGGAPLPRAQSIQPTQPRGMHRAASAPVLWNVGDDDDLPSPFLKKLDRTEPRNVTGVGKTLALDKRPSKAGVSNTTTNSSGESNPTGGSGAAKRLSGAKTTGIKSTATRLSTGKPIARTVSLKP